jgi:hypothetical protein
MSDKGKDFDNQWHESRRESRRRAERGDWPYHEDKYLKRVNKRLSGPPAHHAAASGCWTISLFLVAYAIGFLIALALL